METAMINGKLATQQQIDQYYSLEFPYRYHKWNVKILFRFKELKKGVLQKFNEWTAETATVYKLDEDIWLNESEFSQWVFMMELFNQDQGVYALDIEEVELDENN